MAQFYRAAGRDHLRSELLRQVESEMKTWFEHESALAGLREHYASLSKEKLEELAARLAAPLELTAEERAEDRRRLRSLRAATARLKASFPTPEEYTEWRARRDAEREEEWRASLTRQELIEKRVMPLVWHTEDAEKSKLSQSPLREWFLPEAQGEPMHLHRARWKSP